MDLLDCVCMHNNIQINECLIMYASCKCDNWIKPLIWLINIGGGTNLNLVRLYDFFGGRYKMTWCENWCVETNFTVIIICINLRNIYTAI